MEMCADNAEEENLMFTRTKVLAVSAAMSAAVLFSPALGAAAQTTVGDGLVNVAVGDVNVLNNVDVGVAAQVAAEACGVEVGPIAALANQVDASGTPATVCQVAQGPVRIFQ
jgi:hypothetical protein